MAVNDFLEITRSLRLYVPELPITLAQQFIRDRYRRILDRKDWAGMRVEAEFILNASKSDASVTVVRNSATVTGVSTLFTSTDIGRQFKVGTGSPIYTITDVDMILQTLTLDRVFGGTSAVATSYRIFDGYVTPPADFLRFLVVMDPLQGWRIRHWITASEISSMDPQRTFFGQPWVLADRLYSSTGIPQYEAWPYTSTDRTLYYTYIKRGADLIQDADTPAWPIRSDAIVAGALADVARWPGTSSNPNPYFARPEYWKSYEGEFEDKMVEIERTDEDIYMTWLNTNPFSNYPLAPFSASWLQSHAIRY